MLFGPCDWTLTCIYGPPYVLANEVKGPWATIGDFNEILFSDEKRGGRKPGSSSRMFLEDFMNALGCIYLGYRGSIFTWRNERAGLANFRQHLDRALANVEWRITFPKAGLIHLLL